MYLKSLWQPKAEFFGPTNSVVGAEALESWIQASHLVHNLKCSREGLLYDFSSFLFSMGGFFFGKQIVISVCIKLGLRVGKHIHIM